MGLFFSLSRLKTYVNITTFKDCYLVTGSLVTGTACIDLSECNMDHSPAKLCDLRLHVENCWAEQLRLNSTPVSYVLYLKEQLHLLLYKYYHYHCYDGCMRKVHV